MRWSDSSSLYRPTRRSGSRRLTASDSTRRGVSALRDGTRLLIAKGGVMVTREHSSSHCPLGTGQTLLDHIRPYVRSLGRNLPSSYGAPTLFGSAVERGETTGRPRHGSAKRGEL